MKVLIIDTYFSPYGGGQVISYNTYNLLKKHNIEAYYWALKKEPYFEKDYDGIKYFGGVYRGSANYLKNPVKYYYNYENKKKLNRYIEIIKPDLIHINSFSWMTSAVLDCCRNIPSVITLHDITPLCPAGAVSFLHCKNRCRNDNFLKCIFSSCCKNFESSFRRALMMYLTVKRFKYMNRIIVPSEAVKNAFLKYNKNIESSKIRVINNFVLNDAEDNAISKDGGYFLYAGRLSSEKGLQQLLDALKDLSADIKLHIAGAGDLEQELKQHAARNNLRNVQFLGYLDGQELKNEYKNCTAVIFPSNCFESFGMTAIEAFINSKPVIGSNAGALPEVIEHNKTGLLFEPENTQQLKECILKYWNNPGLALKHGEEGYKKAVRLYTEEIYYEKLTALYREVLNEK